MLVQSARTPIVRPLLQKRFCSDSLLPPVVPVCLLNLMLTIRRFLVHDWTQLSCRLFGRRSAGLQPRCADRPRGGSAVLRSGSGQFRTAAVWLLAAISLTGCGKTLQYSATEQLVLSDAVDKSVATIDFTPLSGTKCYLDSTNLAAVKLTTVVNTSYVASSLRNQLIAAGCLLVESRAEAEVVVEARLGTLGADNHEITYGVPASNLLSQTAAILPAAPPIPTIPEISFAKKDHQSGAAKIAVFAYDPKSGRPIWQSGMSIARSNSRSLWVLGVGPFQSGTVHRTPKFAGTRMSLPLVGQPQQQSVKLRQEVSLDVPHLFDAVPEPLFQHTSASESQPDD